MKRREFINSAGLAITGLALFRPSGVFASNFGEATQISAFASSEFIDSIGVVTHWNYPDTPYGYAYSDVRDMLVQSGIKHFRDGNSNRIEDLAKYGLKSTVVADVRFNTSATEADVLRICDEIKLRNEKGGFIDAVEGPNEPDLFWERFKMTYNGNGYKQGQEGIIKGVVQFQKDLFTQLKSDEATKNLIAIGIALGKTYDPGGGFPNPFQNGELTDFVDCGNFHPYPGGGNPFSYPEPYAGIIKYYWQSNFPSINLDENPSALKNYHPPYQPKPMACTETGWSTHKNGISENTHGKYIPRLFAEYFRLGIKRTFSYEFLDEFADLEKTDGEANFGMIRHDLSPKPGYTALKNLIALLQDEGEEFTPGSLDFKVVPNYLQGYNKRQFIHHLLLQKGNGDFYLMLWHEISAEDISYQPHKQLEHPEFPVKIEVNQSVSDISIFRYNDDLDFVQEKVEMTDNIASITVPDRIIVLKIVAPLTGISDNELNDIQIKNYPNPFRNETTLTYKLPESGQVQIQLFNSSGKLVKILKNEYHNQGSYSVPIDVVSLPPGEYFCKIKSNGKQKSHKLLLVR